MIFNRVYRSWEITCFEINFNTQDYCKQAIIVDSLRWLSCFYKQAKKTILHQYYHYCFYASCFALSLIFSFIFINIIVFIFFEWYRWRMFHITSRRRIVYFERYDNFRKRFIWSMYIRTSLSNEINLKKRWKFFI